MAQPIELILLRQWAGYLTMPVWLMDAEGNLLYYNEPAEQLLGRRFDEAGEMPVGELTSIFQVAGENGSPMPANELSVAVALRQRHPAHQRVKYLGLDGVWRTVEVTSFPVEGQGARLLGAVALFWEVEKS